MLAVGCWTRAVILHARAVLGLGNVSQCVHVYVCMHAYMYFCTCACTSRRGGPAAWKMRKTNNRCWFSGHGAAWCTGWLSKLARAATRQKRSISYTYKKSLSYTQKRLCLMKWKKKKQPVSCKTKVCCKQITKQCLSSTGWLTWLTRTCVTYLCMYAGRVPTRKGLDERLGLCAAYLPRMGR